jgi:hypothetical protein
MNAEHAALRTATSVEPARVRAYGGSVSSARLAGAFGLVSVVVSFIGFSLHGYPVVGASGKEIQHWALTTNQQQFAIGIYIEAIGTLLFLPFAAWLWSVGRDAEGGSRWISTTAFAAAVLYVGSIIDNGVWWAVFDAARRGTNPATLTAMQDIAQHIFDTSLLFVGLFFVTIGYVLFRTRALPRWVAAVTALCGIVLFVPPFQIGGLLEWVWPALLGVYLLIRPHTGTHAV